LRQTTCEHALSTQLIATNQRQQRRSFLNSLPQMARFLPLKLPRVVLALVLMSAAGADAAAATPPNILFVVYDDLRPQLSSFGHDGMKTPHFDSLAAESLVFHRAYTNYPYCAPSRNRSVPSTRALTHFGWYRSLATRVVVVAMHVVS
jgi:hypothetical protein